MALLLSIEDWSFCSDGFGRGINSKQASLVVSAASSRLAIRTQARAYGVRKQYVVGKTLSCRPLLVKGLAHGATCLSLAYLISTVVKNWQAVVSSGRVTGVLQADVR